MPVKQHYPEVFGPFCLILFVTKKENNIEDLIVKYLQQTLSVAEQAELDRWVNSSAANRELFEKLKDPEWLKGELNNIYAIDDRKAWEKITSFNEQVNRPGKKISKIPVRKLWLRITAAASVIGFVFMTSYFLRSTGKNNIVQPIVVHSTNDVKAPEKNRAMITLSNGNVVYLDSVANGSKLAQAGVNLIKQSDGQLAYKADAGSETLLYNTLFNPRGSKSISIVLGDGTKVWLNSETTLRYPVNFVGNERRVEVAGEAYFEVAKMPSKPFKVVSGKMEVEVLGTHFNINAYADEEAVETTLLEGKVKLTSGVNKVEIAPGQQAQFSEKTRNGFKVESGVDVDKAVAWKEGLFQFDNAELPVIMRQIGRWYNINIKFEDTHGDEKFGGAIARRVPLSDVLKMLEVNGIHFKLDDKTIIVKP